MTLKFDAEKRAEKATSLPAFPVNLPDVRRVVKEILSTFGSNLIFKEYTTHDITHIDDMLSTVGWIIPEKTKEVMSEGDWLMLVLSIYFHDMGLIVTEQEFENRSKSSFEHFCKEKLFSGQGGDDYKSKVDALDKGHRDRFLYQEFVRHHHATRIKVWLSGDECFELGYCAAQIELIDKLLSKLSPEFRADLALVCESHNLDDIEDTKKYRQNHPYGNSDSEEVNLQYIAALLRTIDLIQITKRRAPSALYRLIDPTDPISQQEWAKQNAVTRVRAQLRKDEDGAVAHNLQPDTIEVFAQFENEASYFGLNSYLRYANEQVRETYQSLDKSKKTASKEYHFPWRRVDGTNVVASGFEQEPFGFEIDQEKILDLLTGHTLYNDSSVVVRELLQNAVDAVRLQYFDTKGGSEENGHISVEWNTEKNELTITDNGTGMSQYTIENHLLKVGSSKYQDPKFREQNPNFTPISRFGIGVLTAFMVADKVEITTVSPDDEKARRISLRSVHGNYLIKLLDKANDKVAKAIGKHGTQFVLKFRASAKSMNLERTLESYVLFPRCEVTLKIDAEDVIPVGYSQPKDALEDYLAKETTIRRYGEEKTVVRQVSSGGITVAYAMSYSSHYKDWQFVRVSERTLQRRADTRQAPTMTCVEGIVVQTNLVGGFDRTLLAVVNMTGKAAPKTNVARSALETTGEFEEAISTINRLLLDAVEEECRRLVEDEDYSLTWAVEQMPFLMGPIAGGSGAEDGKVVASLKSKELNKTRMFLAEEKGQRTAISAESLKKRGEFWMVDSMLLTSTEQFIRESKREIARSKLLSLVYGDDDNSMEDQLVVPNVGNSPICTSVIQESFDIAQFRGMVNERRLDVKWKEKSERWVPQIEIFRLLIEADDFQNYELYRHMTDSMERNVYGRAPTRNVVFPATRDHISSEGLEDFHGVVALRSLYLLPGNPVSDCIIDAPDDWKFDVKRLRRLYFNSLVAGAFSERYLKDVSEGLAYLRKIIPEQLIESSTESLEACQQDWEAVGKLVTYDPFSWKQRNVDGIYRHMFQ